MDLLILILGMNSRLVKRFDKNSKVSFSISA